MEDHMKKQVYITVLCDTLKRKVDVLDELMALTKQQEMLITNENLDEQVFDELLIKKDEQINSLSKLDVGFEQIYENVQTELQNNREQYKSEILELKEYITRIIEKNIELQSLEAQNKLKIESMFAKKRKEIGNSRMSNQTITNYYKNMANQHQQNQSYFYDKKE